MKRNFTLWAVGLSLFLAAGIVTAANVTKITNGSSHSIAVKANGKVFSWGSNAYGQLGNGNNSSANTPQEITTSGALIGKFVTTVSSGNSHSLALASDGTVYAWGQNNYGQLGNGNTGTNSNVPVAVSTSGVLSGKIIVAIAAGYGFSLALASDGTVYAWGQNNYGQLGYSNTGTDSNIPVAVTTTGSLSGKTVAAIDCGNYHVIVRASDNSLHTWGLNDKGQLGNGNMGTDSDVPVAITTSGALNGKTITAITAGSFCTYALASDGTVYASGRNIEGELGNGDNTNSDIPVAVSTTGVLSGKTIIKINAGFGHALALSSDSTVYSWGYNVAGELGNGNTGTDSNVPVTVTASGELSGKKISAISAGESYSLALASNGLVYSWGRNTNGQLGDASNTNSNVPVAIPLFPIPPSPDVYGNLDGTFNTTGKRWDDIGGTSNSVANAIAIQSDGKVIAAGKGTPGSYNRFAIVRYNTNGTLDNTFGTNGTVFTQVGAIDSYINSIALQSDGKIIAVGYLGHPSDFVVVRYNSDGSLDNTFGTNGIVLTDFLGNSDVAKSVAIQQDGKIVVVGDAYAFVAGDGNGQRFTVVRYNTNGTLDNTFGTGGKVITFFGSGNESACSVVLQSNGKIVVSGYTYRGIGLVRYNSDGSLDTNFDTDGKWETSDVSYSTGEHVVAIDANGKILFLGTKFSDEGSKAMKTNHSNHSRDNLNQVTTVTEGLAVLRLNANGGLDPTFGTNGMTLVDSTFTGVSISVQQNGKIVVAGNTVSYLAGASTSAIIRLLSDGSLDNTFDFNGVNVFTAGGSGYISSMAIHSDGKIVVVGEYSSDNTEQLFFAARFIGEAPPVVSFGNIDVTFGNDGKRWDDIGGNLNSAVNSIALQPDGKILTAGSCFDGTVYLPTIVRYNADGTLDNSFGTSGIALTGTPARFAKSIMIQSDGKIVVTAKGDPMNFYVLRYNSNGSLDNTFGTGGIVSTDFYSDMDEPNSVVIQSDGKIVVVGEVQPPMPVSFVARQFGVARYTTNGTLDNTFGTGGKVITSFGTGDGMTETAYSVVIQSDGKIIVAGEGYNSTEGLGLVRYAVDGSLDASFGTGGKLFDGNIQASTTNGSIGDRSLVLQSDGKIIVIGMSTSTGSITLARYSSTGVLDASFSSSGYADIGFGNYVKSIFIQSDGKYVVTGGVAPIISSANPDGVIHRAGSMNKQLNILTVPASYVIRFKSDGSLDPDFGTAGVTTFGTDEWVNTAAIQDDGNIVFAGNYNPGTPKYLFLTRLSGGVSTPLPVEIVSLIASAKNNLVELKWNTATEVNNYGFAIERRVTGNSQLAWAKIGFIEGAGTSNAPRSYSYVDNVLNGTIAYRLKQIDRDGKFKYSGDVEVIVNGAPSVFSLSQNYPNPFNPSTTIAYQLPATGHVILKVYDVIGREVASLVNEVKSAGSYSVQFDALKLASGMYFSKLQSGDKMQIKKMMLIK